MILLKHGAQRFAGFFFLFILSLIPPLCFAQVPNDTCASTIEILSLPFTNTQDTRLATASSDDPEPTCLGSAGGRTVWYAFKSDR